MKEAVPSHRRPGYQDRGWLGERARRGNRAPETVPKTDSRGMAVATNAEEPLARPMGPLLEEGCEWSQQLSRGHPCPLQLCG